jgi:uncharacterized membrane protein
MMGFLRAVLILSLVVGVLSLLMAHTPVVVLVAFGLFLGWVVFQGIRPRLG